MTVGAAFLFFLSLCSPSSLLCVSDELPIFGMLVDAELKSVQSCPKLLGGGQKIRKKVRNYKTSSAMAAAPAEPTDGCSVLLDNLPWSFSDATLKSIIEHVQCKGKVISTTLTPEAEKATAQIVFERSDDADAAIRLWDQLTIDGAVITATTAAEARKKALGTKSGSAANHGASTYRYPFATMNIGWLVEYVNGLKATERLITMCRVLECLMINAVATADTFLECAVVQFYTKFSSATWGKAQCAINDSVTFELSRQVFEVIGLVNKVPWCKCEVAKNASQPRRARHRRHWQSADHNESVGCEQGHPRNSVEHPHKHLGFAHATTRGYAASRNRSARE